MCDASNKMRCLFKSPVSFGWQWARTSPNHHVKCRVNEAPLLRQAADPGFAKHSVAGSCNLGADVKSGRRPHRAQHSADHCLRLRTVGASGPWQRGSLAPSIQRCSQCRPVSRASSAGFPCLECRDKGSHMPAVRGHSWPP